MKVVPLLLATALFLTAPLRALAAPTIQTIADIRAFLDRCPQNDPAFSQILLDFEIRRHGQPTSVPFCSEPVSAMKTAEYTDELIVLQGLRVTYYMDRGMSGHLPWTPGTLYNWMRSKIGGIDLQPGLSSCCAKYGNRTFITVSEQNDFNRDFDKQWMGIGQNIALYAHETRHTNGYPHSGLCCAPGSCDVTYDEKDVSAYAVQW